MLCIIPLMRSSFWELHVWLCKSHLTNTLLIYNFSQFTPVIADPHTPKLDQIRRRSSLPVTFTFLRRQTRQKSRTESRPWSHRQAAEAKFTSGRQASDLFSRLQVKTVQIEMLKKYCDQVLYSSATVYGEFQSDLMTPVPTFPLVGTPWSTTWETAS